MIETVIGVALVAGVGLLGTGILAIWTARMRRSWDRAARELGLTLEPARWHEMPSMTGRMGDARIRVHARSVGRAWTTVVEVVVHGRLPCDVVMVRREAQEDAVMLTGDPVFDRAVVVHGVPHRTMAMLGGEARRAARECLAWFPGACLRTHPSREGEMELEIPRIVDDAEVLVQAVRHLVAVAQAASLGTRTIVEALADNARDEVPGVREHCLDALVGEYSRNALTAETCRAALADEKIGVRLAAARGLGSEGHPALDGMIGDATLGPGRRLTALDLRLRGPLAEIGPVLDSLLEIDDDILRPEIIKAIGSRHWLPALERLLEIAGPLAYPLSAVLPTTLGQLDDARAQPILLRWLDAGQGWDDARVAIVTALGRAGSVEAIPALEQATHGAPPQVRTAARSAIREIQERLGPVDAGRLSLVELADAAGELSVADDVSGRVSLPEREQREDAP